MMKSVDNLGDRLKRARIRKGINSQELAKDCGFGLNFVSRIETGETPDPGVLKVAKLAAKLDVSIDWLAGLTD